MVLIMNSIPISKKIKWNLLMTNMQVATMLKAMGLQEGTQLLLATTADINNT